MNPVLSSVSEELYQKLYVHNNRPVGRTEWSYTQFQVTPLEYYTTTKPSLWVSSLICICLYSSNKNVSLFHTCTSYTESVKLDLCTNYYIISTQCPSVLFSNITLSLLCEIHKNIKHYIRLVTYSSILLTLLLS